MELTCKEFVEIVTQYLEGVMSPFERDRFEAHIEECGNCATYLAQMRTTLHLAGELTEDSIEPGMRRRLLAAFRGWRSADGAPG